jgi:hypothetical protein
MIIPDINLLIYAYDDMTPVPQGGKGMVGKPDQREPSDWNSLDWNYRLCPDHDKPPCHHQPFKPR